MGGARWLSYYVLPVTGWRRNKRTAPLSPPGNEIVCCYGEPPPPLLHAASKFVISPAWIIHLLLRSPPGSIQDEKSVRIFVFFVSATSGHGVSETESEGRRGRKKLSSKSVWLRVWRRGRSGLGLRASPSVSAASIQSCQSIHICIDPSGSPSALVPVAPRSMSSTRSDKENLRRVCPRSSGEVVRLRQ